MVGYIYRIRHLNVRSATFCPAVNEIDSAKRRLRRNTTMQRRLLQDAQFTVPSILNEHYLECYVNGCRRLLVLNNIFALDMFKKKIPLNARISTYHA